MADEDHLRSLFNTFDRDGSGTLDAEELLEILTRGTSSLSLEDAKEIVNDFDDNKDGVLSVEEFVKAMAAVGQGVAQVPALDAHVRVASGPYKGRVGVVKALVDKNHVYEDGQGGEALPAVAFSVHFLDGSAGRALIAEKAPEDNVPFGVVEGTLDVISKVELEAVVTADRTKRDAQRKAMDAAQEAALQIEWEKRGKSGRVPRVGADRTSPIAPDWWDLPWFDEWVAGGCDHQLLGISVEGIQRCLEEFGGGGMGDNRNFCDTFWRESHPGLEWVTEAFGKQEDTGPIGYDLGHFVRIWDAVSMPRAVPLLLCHGEAREHAWHAPRSRCNLSTDRG